MSLCTITTVDVYVSSVYLFFLQIGVLVAIVPKFIKCDPAVVIATIKQHGISLVIGSPAFLARLSTYASKHDIILPVAGVGGAPVYRYRYMYMIGYNYVEYKNICVL